MEYFVNIIIIIMFVGSYVGVWFLGGYFGNKYRKKDEEEQTIEELFIDLREAIIKEDYEQAAIIRDKLRKLTK